MLRRLGRKGRKTRKKSYEMRKYHDHVFDAFCEGICNLAEQSEKFAFKCFIEEQKRKPKRERERDQGTAYWSIMSVYSFESADSYMHGRA